MGLQKFQAQSGRITASSASNLSPQQVSCNSRYHGLMASSFSRKYLVCFYCNNKSGIKYDGHVKQWECGICESMNFLDENGDITDPPVATDYAAPVDRTYAIPRPESPPSSQESDTTLFCSTCLKNQHLFTASLAQYDIDLDTYSPHYKENERKYFKYRKGLEKRYPQVCEDCEPKVLERMRQAGKTAKTDYLRRLMEKSRAKRSGYRTAGISLSLGSIGKWLWYYGLLAQVTWHFIALSAATKHKYPEILQNFLPVSISTTLSNFSDYLIYFSAPRLARSSLFCSIASAWWNPKYKQMKNGFMNHIKGFGDWYKYQALLLTIRGLCYFLMGTGVLADPNATATITAHTFVLGFVTYLAFAANSSLKVDMTPLWASTPERLPNVGPGGSPNHITNDLADALDEIAATPSRRSYQRPSPPSTIHSQERDIANNHELSSLNINDQPRNRYPLHVHNDVRQFEEMDWSPSQSQQSQHRAFATNVQLPSQPFGQNPIDPHASPFWYKVPPAPTNPARQLRNPINPPRFRVSSREVKENFFNNVTRRSLPSEQHHENGQPSGASKSRHEIEFSQQKFFPPALPSEAGNNLADLLTSFSLGSSEHENPTPVGQGSMFRHVCQGLVLSVGLIFWNQLPYHPSEQTRNVPLAIMLVCFCIGLRTILDNTLLALSIKRHAIVQSLEVIFGGVECIASAWGVLEILGGTNDYPEFSSLGTILIGGMMVHELWLVSFG